MPATVGSEHDVVLSIHHFPHDVQLPGVRAGIDNDVEEVATTEHSPSLRGQLET